MRRTLLIVDDNSAFRSAARALLQAAGFAVVGEAANGTEAVLAARRLCPDIVLLDITLPDMDGFDVARIIASDGPPGMIIVLTSSRDVSSYGPKFEAGPARDFVAKHELTGAALRAITG